MSVPQTHVATAQRTASGRAESAVATRRLLAVAGIVCAGASLDLSLGYFKWASFALMVAAAAAFVAVVLMPAVAEDRTGRYSPYQLVLGLFGLLCAAGPLTPGLSQRILILVPVIVLASPLRAMRRAWFWTVLGVLVISQAWHLVEIAGLRSDINISMAAGFNSLIRGHSIYILVPQPGAPPGRMPYPPGAVLLTAPSIALTGDTRWALLAAELVACAVTWRLLPRGDAGPEAWREALVLIPLALPRVIEYFFEAANLEWVLLALTAVIVLALVRGRALLAAVLLGLGMATKQTFILYPAIFLARFLRPRLVVVAAIVAAAIVVPFVAQDPGMAASALLDPATHGMGDYPGRLHLYAALVAAGLSPGRPVLLALQAFGLACAVFFWLRSRGNLALSLSASGAAWTVLVLLSPFAGYNYYAFGLALFCWGLALEVGGAGIEPATSSV